MDYLNIFEQLGYYRALISSIAVIDNSKKCCGRDFVFPNVIPHYEAGGFFCIVFEKEWLLLKHKFILLFIPEHPI